MNEAKRQRRPSNFHRGKCHVMTVLALAAFSSSCNSHAYYDEARQYVDVMETVLIAAGQCDSAEDCRKKNLVFFEAGGTSIGPLHFGGVFVNV